MLSDLTFILSHLSNHSICFRIFSLLSVFSDIKLICTRRCKTGVNTFDQWMNLTFWPKIENWISFPMSLVWSYSIGYNTNLCAFTEYYSIHRYEKKKEKDYLVGPEKTKIFSFLTSQILHHRRSCSNNMFDVIRGSKRSWGQLFPPSTSQLYPHI